MRFNLGFYSSFLKLTIIYLVVFFNTNHSLVHRYHYSKFYSEKY